MARALAAPGAARRGRPRRRRGGLRDPGRVRRRQRHQHPRRDHRQWAARGVLRAVDDYVQRDKFDLSRFYAAATDEVKYDNKTYGIPQFMTARGLYVNTDALQEAGLDAKSLDPGKWEQLTEVAGKLVKKTG